MAKPQTPETPPVIPAEEGPRSFSRFVADYNRGEMESEAAYSFHKLLREMSEEAHSSVRTVNGAFALKLKVAVDEQGHVAIRYEVEAKAPKRKTSAGVYWLTRGFNLTAKNPAQAELPLREVSAAPTAREIDHDPPRAPKEA